MVRCDPTGHSAPEVPHLNCLKELLKKELLLSPNAPTLFPLFLVEDNGFEPLTPCVQGRCSSQLS